MTSPIHAVPSHIASAINAGVPDAVLQQLIDIDEQHCVAARIDPNAFNTYVLRHEETNQPIIQSPWHSATR